ncbi:hypothetical protein N5P18_10780 [Janibacter terrae]|uniref:Uncharacterized protein n=1 Tax=Janibacter terrae TaxID=103817 RepID=A0ABZ2FA59_9MICO|nr:hypothetical protein [Janibacter terrae]
MWWLLGGIAAAIAGLGAVIARRGGSMSSSDIDGHAKGVAEAVHVHNNNAGAG